MLIVLSNFLMRGGLYCSSFLAKEISFSKFNEAFINMYVPLVFFNAALMPYLIESFYNQEP